VFTHPFSALRVGGPTFKTGEQMNSNDADTQGKRVIATSPAELVTPSGRSNSVQDVFDDFESRLLNFVVEAYSLLGDLRDEAPNAEEVAQHLAAAAKQKQEILDFLAKVSDLDAPWNPPGFFQPKMVTDFVNLAYELLLVWVERKEAEDELRLFLTAIERAGSHQVVDLRSLILQHPRKSVEQFAQALAALELDAIEAAHFHYHKSPWVWPYDLGIAAYGSFKSSFSLVLRFMEHGIDRWIYPRLGTNPDEWTTRLSQRLYSLREAVALASNQAWYLTEQVYFKESVERTDELCYEVSRMAEELRTIRFDVEDPVFKPEQEPTPETSTGSDQITEAHPSRICRLKADIDANQIWLDDVPYLVYRRSVIYLQAVLENEQDVPLKPISGRAIHERYPEFPRNKVSVYRDKLPPEVRELIDTSGNGSCLTPNAYKNPEKPDATR
jgi:hypothetical protein